MGTYITANLLNQIGLFLGLVSGLLLIPEVINLFQTEKLQKSVERRLYEFENWAKFPLKFGPPSWKVKYTEEEREAIEPITAVRSLIFSIVWIAILVVGILFSSKFFIVLSLMILIAVTLGNIRRYLYLWPQLGFVKSILMFVSSFLLLAIVTPLFSLVRVAMMLLRSIAAKVHRFFSAHDVFRSSLTILAIITFIVSNILQFVATLDIFTSVKP